EPPVRVRLLDRIQIFALDVLDERDREKTILRDVPRDDRYFEQAGALRGAPATLACDDLITAVHVPDDDRLNDAVGADRSRELLDFPFVDRRPRLDAIGTETVGIHFERALGGRRDSHGNVGNEGGRATAEGGAC